MKLLLILLLGCPKGEPEPSEAPEPPAAAEPVAGEPARSTCVESCLSTRMMEARDAAAIEADCRRSCGEDEAPVVEQGDRLQLHFGQRATVVGTLTQGEGGAMIELADGAKVLVDSMGYPHGWEGLAGKKIRVTGTVEARDGGMWLANPDAPLPG